MNNKTIFKEQFSKRFSTYLDRISHKFPVIHAAGKLTKIIGLTIEAVGLNAPIGSYCKIINSNNTETLAEVIGFDNSKIILMPIGDTQGLESESIIVPLGTCAKVPVGDTLLGRVVNGCGQAIDNLGALGTTTFSPLYGVSINPLSRARITHCLDVGVRVINGLLTIGRGQRIGLFSGSGVGKSVLLGMMTRYTSADVIVIGMIGERGKEVNDFIQNNLDESSRKRTVVIVSPADEPPLLRLHGALSATTIAEYFRNQGKHVLLLMDSLTRFAQAQREISLAIGEPPATKGYTPSVFYQLPRLVERAGNIEQGGGSITAIYTVLAEGDDQQDPIVDASRAILDGHIVLSRDLADAGIYPAIDIEKSISRVMPDIIDEQHLQYALSFKKYYSCYQQGKDLIDVGAYAPGNNIELDTALNKMPDMMRYIQQGINEKVTISDSVDNLYKI